MTVKPDFGGYVATNDQLCTDGTTIRGGAFSHHDGQIVPLLYAHDKKDPTNIIGKVRLEERPGGMYGYGYLNNTKKAKDTKEAIVHGDVKSLSIYATRVQMTPDLDVTHGEIKEVSIVVSGADPGAYIDRIFIEHGEALVSDDKAIIYSGSGVEVFEHAEEDESVKETELPTIKELGDFYNDLDDQDKLKVDAMITLALQHSEEEDQGQVESETSEEEETEEDQVENNENADEEEVEHDEEGNPVTQRIFTQTDTTSGKAPVTLTHEDYVKIINTANTRTKSVRDAAIDYIEHSDYGITNIGELFPDAKLIRGTPDWVKRQTEWVQDILNGVTHSPFAKVKSMSADITADTARAKGYIKGTMKKDEFFALLKRSTGPTTIYKKQKFDRDDLLDASGFDVIAWVKGEMRIMLEEEIARAIVMGDGRDVDDEDKIKDGSIDNTGIRPIIKDDEFYTHKVTISSNVAGTSLVDEVIRNRKFYKGSGTPVALMGQDVVSDLLTLKDNNDRYLYDTIDILANKLRVSKIIEIPLFDEQEPDHLVTLISLGDYDIGTNAGGETTMFDDFDIDFNQMKYLLETRLSGALTLPKSAVTIWKSSGTEVVATAPTFNQGTNTISIPNTTGVEYVIDNVVKTGSVVIDKNTQVQARAKSNYFLKANTAKVWFFEYKKPA